MEFSWNYGTLINIHLQHKKHGPCSHGSFSQNDRKGREDLPPLPPSPPPPIHPPGSSYTPVVIRMCRILLLNKFTIMKLKTDVFSFSTVLL